MKRVFLQTRYQIMTDNRHLHPVISNRRGWGFLAVVVDLYVTERGGWVEVETYNKRELRLRSYRKETK